MSNKKMKISDAMLRGMKVLPDAIQVEGSMCEVVYELATDGNNERAIDGCCAEGFAFFGAFGADGIDYALKGKDLGEALRRVFPDLTDKSKPVKYGKKTYDTVEDLVWKLNDEDNFSITRIAKILRSKGF